MKKVATGKQYQAERMKRGSTIDVAAQLGIHYSVVNKFEREKRVTEKQWVRMMALPLKAMTARQLRQARVARNAVKIR